MSKIIKEALSELTPENLPKTFNGLTACIGSMLKEPEPMQSYCALKLSFDLVLDNTVTKSGGTLQYQLG